MTRALLNKRKGFSLIEVIVGAAIITVSVLAAVGAYNTYVVYALNNSKHVRAALLLEEGVEAVKFIRDSGWSTIESTPTDIPRYLLWDGGKWTISDTPMPYVDGVFDRSIMLEAVRRDGNSDISDSGSIDNNSRKLTVSLSYKAGQSTTTKSVSTYIMNLHDN